MEVRGSILRKRTFVMWNLTKGWKLPPVVILHQATFHNIFILRLRLRIKNEFDLGV